MVPYFARGLPVLAVAALGDKHEKHTLEALYTIESAKGLTLRPETLRLSAQRLPTEAKIGKVRRERAGMDKGAMCIKHIYLYVYIPVSQHLHSIEDPFPAPKFEFPSWVNLDLKAQPNSANICQATPSCLVGA